MLYELKEREKYPTCTFKITEIRDNKTLIHPCGRVSLFMCDFCGKIACSEHMGGVFGGDMCNTCYYERYGKPIPITYAFEAGYGKDRRSVKVTDMVPEKLVVRNVS